MAKPAPASAPKSSSGQPQAASEDKRQFPLVTAFCAVKANQQWHAIALRIQGRELVDEIVIGSFADRLEVSDQLELAMKDHVIFDKDFFADAEVV